jgi:hypothetical protein
MATHGREWSSRPTSGRDEVTLEHKEGTEVERFVGVIVKDYTVYEHNGPTRPLQMADIPLGKIIRVCYIPYPQKVNGTKVEVNSIFMINTAPNIAASQAIFMGLTN